MWLLGIIGILVAFHLTKMEQSGLQVIGPEFMCDNDLSGATKSNFTKIRLVGPLEPNSTLSISVNFKNRAVPRQNVQQFNLKMWRLTRQLQTDLNKSNFEILNRNEIMLNNSQLVPGVRYEFSLTVTDASGVNSTGQYSIDYVDMIKETGQDSTDRIPVSVALNSPGEIYSGAICLLTTSVAVCTTSVSNYFLEWSILDETNTTIELETSKGSSLELPPFTLKAPGNYLVKCEVKSDTNETLAESSAVINVIPQGLMLSLSVEYLVVSKNTQFQLEIDFVDLDNSNNEMNIEWNCTASDTGEPCPEVLSENSTRLEITNGISIAGKYDVSVKLTYGDVSINSSCVVQVTEDEALPVIRASASLPLQRVDPSKAVEIPISIFGLISGCTVQWTGLQLETDGVSCSYVDLAEIPGNLGDLKKVTTIEDTFLEGMTDYSNETVSGVYSLIIPPPEGSWLGLDGDTCYRFRITVICKTEDTFGPDDVDSGEVVADISSDNTTDNNVTSNANETASLSLTETVYADLIIKTNAPPVPSSLEVEPSEGEALTTVFTFRSEPASDKVTDYPLLYQFGYIINNETKIPALRTGDPSEVRLTLPYSGSAVTPYLEVCDTWGSCATIFGNEINTLLPNLTSEQIVNIVQSIEQLTERQEYSKAFTAAADLLLTSKALSEEVFLNISKKIDLLTATEIGNLINRSVDAISKRKSVAALLTEIKKIDEYNVLTDSTIQALVNVRDDIFERKSANRAKREVANQRKNVNVNLETVKAFIEISELVILKSNNVTKINEEMKKFKTKINNYFLKICRVVDAPIKIVTKMVSIGFEKLNKKTLNEVASVPFPNEKFDDAKLRFGRDTVQLLNKSTDYCIGKFSFARDFFSNENSSTEERVYSVVIYDDSNKSEVDFKKFNDYSVNVKIPVIKYASIKKGEIYQCRTYIENNWSITNCILVSINAEVQPKQIHCKCNKLATFALFVVKKNNSVVTTTTSKVIRKTTASPKTTTTTLQPVLTTSNIKNATTSNNQTVNDRSARILESGVGSGFDVLDAVNSILVLGILGTLVASAIVWKRKTINTIRQQSVVPLEAAEIKYAQIYGNEMLN